MRLDTQRIARQAFPFVFSLVATACAFAQAAGDKTLKNGFKTQSPDVLKQVLAEVDGEKISRGDVFSYAMRLTKRQIPKVEEQKNLYDYAINALVNIRLLSQFLREHDVAVPEAELDKEMKNFADQIKAETNQDLKTFCDANGTSEAKLRDEIATPKRFRKYFLKCASDEELRRFYIQNGDVFNGTQIRASHILLRVSPDAPAAEKEKVKKRLLGIRAEIIDGKISFADAANKYTEDQNAADQTGGDLGYFPRRGRFPEDFSNAAFALRTINAISQPIDTAYGYHLIQLTDRKPGQEIKFDENKELILNEFAAELQPKLMSEEKAKKKSKIVIQPMPDDFFPVVEPPAEEPKKTVEEPKKTAKTGE